MGEGENVAGRGASITHIFKLTQLYIAITRRGSWIEPTPGGKEKLNPRGSFNCQTSAELALFLRDRHHRLGITVKADGIFDGLKTGKGLLSRAFPRILFSSTSSWTPISFRMNKHSTIRNVE